MACQFLPKPTSSAARARTCTRTARATGTGMRNSVECCSSRVTGMGTGLCAGGHTGVIHGRHEVVLRFQLPGRVGRGQLPRQLRGPQLGREGWRPAKGQRRTTTAIRTRTRSGRRTPTTGGRIRNAGCGIGWKGDTDEREVVPTYKPAQLTGVLTVDNTVQEGQVALTGVSTGWTPPTSP